MKINQNTRLIGEKVILVPYEASHVPKYHSWMEDPELRQLTASELLSLEDEYEMQRKWREDEDKCTFIILSKHSLDQGQSEIDSMVGDVNLFLVKGEDEVESELAKTGIIAEVEIMIAERAFRGQGLGQEAVIMMMLYGADYLNIRKFQVKIGSGNVTSLKLFEKLGFRKVKYIEVFDEVTLVCDFTSDDGPESSVFREFRKRCPFAVDAYHKC